MFCPALYIYKIYTYKYTYLYTCRLDCNHIYVHTLTYTVVTFSAEIVIFGRCILRFPEFHKVPLFAAVLLFEDNRKTIFSHKINLKLFQKQYNSLIKKSFFNICNI